MKNMLSLLNILLLDVAPPPDLITADGIPILIVLLVAVLVVVAVFLIVRARKKNSSQENKASKDQK